MAVLRRGMIHVTFDSWYIKHDLLHDNKYFTAWLVLYKLSNLSNIFSTNPLFFPVSRHHFPFYKFDFISIAKFKKNVIIIKSSRLKY